MVNTEIERFEEFLSGKMDVNEQENFNRELMTDKALLDAFNTYRAIEMSMLNSSEYCSETDLKNSLNKFGGAFFNSVPGDPKTKEQTVSDESTSMHAVAGDKARAKVFTLRHWAAAVLIGIVALSAVYFLTREKSTLNEQVAVASKGANQVSDELKNNVDTTSKITVLPNNAKGDSSKKNSNDVNRQQTLFAKYFKPDVLPQQTDGPLEEAFDLYESGEYKKAAKAFENADLDLVTRGEESDIAPPAFYAAYYKALSYIAADNDAKAVSVLSHITIGVPLLSAKVSWYLALAYIKTGNTNKALLLLQKLSHNAQAGSYRVQAKKLMNELGSTNR